ncbi:hypothetical protein NIES4073_72310 [Kalymmatonema gypsitolerans NIES-4073]|nr:hypothetical protein NIES4073_72310 [Scytonema sp. NIES-4073]
MNKLHTISNFMLFQIWKIYFWLQKTLICQRKNHNNRNFHQPVPLTLQQAVPWKIGLNIL